MARDATGTALGAVLVEAKSYPGEFRPNSGGTRAEGGRLKLIERRLRETRRWVGVAETPELAKLWLGPLYQSANRFATLCFFRSFCDPMENTARVESLSGRWAADVVDRPHATRSLR